MDTAKVTELMQLAKSEHDHGVFTVLKQAEFFKAMSTAIGEAPAPAPAVRRGQLEPPLMTKVEPLPPPVVKHETPLAKRVEPEPPVVKREMPESPPVKRDK